MRILLDTHVFLWLLSDPDRISLNWTKLIEDPSNDLYLSIASLWEIAIKSSLQKLRLAVTFSELATEYVPEMEIEILPIAIEHLAVVEKLPRHHGDPFDRLIIAQGIVEKLSVMTLDPKLASYEVAMV